MASVVQVNDPTGCKITNVKTNETVKQALRRLRQFGTLEDKDGIALLDEEIITAEAGPYVFKLLIVEPQQQQQQQPNGK